jgi:glycosyltransferase involved in cell wall biosynthesis
MRRRVLLVQPSMQPPGGGNGVAAWMLQALVAEHEVTVLSWWPVDIEPINRFFGTGLRAGDFATLVVPHRYRSTLDLLPTPAALLRSSLLMRHTRTVADGFDIVIGAHNETDYGRRGIQYVHYPTYLRPRPEVDLRWYHVAPTLDVYYRLADRIAGFSLSRMRSNVTLANSDWTAAKIRTSLGIDAETLYPPVTGPSSVPDWSARRRGFITMGRFSPEKEYERVIRILARVRAYVPDLSLTIVGTVDRASRAYYQRLKTLAASLDDDRWIAFRHDLSRDDVRSLIAANRYGIHGMREEHFGMAPAEMVMGGMIVWVPNGGGQVEIVGDAPLLRYGSEEEAVEKIARVVNDSLEERRLLTHLAQQSEQFGTERFMAAIRRVVSAFHP